MVQRYFVPSSEGRLDDGGQFVKYEDYARLKEEFMDYIVRTQKELDELNKIIEVLDDDR